MGRESEGVEVMKAILGGITVEGTPQEVWDFLQKQQAAGTQLKPVQPMPQWDGPWWGVFPPSQEYGSGTATTPDYFKTIIVS